MQIGILGGGPAGLYFAILMKRADPGHHIEVFERNAPDDTFGWGVVFSEATLYRSDVWPLQLDVDGMRALIGEPAKKEAAA